MFTGTYPRPWTLILVGHLLVTGVAAAADSEKPGSTGVCKPPPAKARIKVNLKPDTEVADLIAWYSTLTCTPMLVSSGTTVAGKKVTILSPTPIRLAELHRLFLGALDSVGLTVQPDGKFLYIIDAARARHSNTPVVPAR
jgi:type II secretory pathway component GspD/PulD (secretin)